MNTENSPLRVALAFVGMALVVGTFAHLMNRDDDVFFAESALGAPPPLPAASDTELGDGPVSTELKPADDVVYRQFTAYSDGSPRVVKTVFANHTGRYLHPRGNFVLYEFRRADGTLEKDKLVEPEPTLSSSVITKYRWRYFAADGKTVESSDNFRADGTHAAHSDDLKNRYVQYRMDGKTVREVQENVGKDTIVTYYLPDGKTPWWTYNYDTHAGVVVNDRQGKALNIKFKRDYLVGSFSMGSDDPPLKEYVDNYLRADGTVAYRQTWYHFYDKARRDFVHALGRVEVLAADGKTVVRDIEFDLRSHRGALSVKKDSAAAGTALEATWTRGYGPLNLYGYDNDFVDSL